MKERIKSKTYLLLRRAFFMRHQQNITYCEADGAYTIIYFDKFKPETVAYNIKVIEEHLSSSNFIRIHKSYLVNTNAICEVCKYCKKLVLRNGQEITIARQRKKQIISVLSNTEVLIL